MDFALFFYGSDIIHISAGLVREKNEYKLQFICYLLEIANSSTFPEVSNDYYYYHYWARMSSKES